MLSPKLIRPRQAKLDQAQQHACCLALARNRPCTPSSPPLNFRPAKIAANSELPLFLFAFPHTATSPASSSHGHARKDNDHVKQEASSSYCATPSLLHYCNFMPRPAHFSHANCFSCMATLLSNSSKACQLRHSFSTRRGASSTFKKQLDAKTLRRLAQNGEAARKSRLRKGLCSATRNK